MVQPSPALSPMTLLLLFYSEFTEFCIHRRRLLFIIKSLTAIVSLQVKESRKAISRGTKKKSSSGKSKNTKLLNICLTFVKIHEQLFHPPFDTALVKAKPRSLRISNNDWCWSNPRKLSMKLCYWKVVPLNITQVKLQPHYPLTPSPTGCIYTKYIITTC